MADYELDLELDSEGELSERSGPKRPSSQPSFKQRPPAGTPSGVTQAQLEAALSRVDGKIKTVADGVSTINSRLGTIANATKKEIDERKKNLDNTNKDLNSKLMMLAILPALVQPTFSVPNVVIPTGTTILGVGGPSTAPTYLPFQGQSTAAAAGTSFDISADSNMLNLMLPVLAIAGGGLGFGTDSTTGGTDNGMMMMLALVLALSGKKN